MNENNRGKFKFTDSQVGLNSHQTSSTFSGSFLTPSMTVNDNEKKIYSCGGAPTRSEPDESQDPIHARFGIKLRMPVNCHSQIMSAAYGKSAKKPAWTATSSQPPRQQPQQKLYPSTPLRRGFFWFLENNPGDVSHIRLRLCSALV